MYAFILFYTNTQKERKKERKKERERERERVSGNDFLSYQCIPSMFYELLRIVC